MTDLEQAITAVHRADQSRKPRRPYAEVVRRERGERGLRADPISVAAAVESNGFAPFVSFEEEHAFDARVATVTKAQRCVEGYGRQHRATFAGVEAETGFFPDFGLHVAFTSDLDSHRAALEQLVDVSEVPLHLHPATHTLTEMEAARQADLSEVGLRLGWSKVHVRENRVTAVALADDARAAGAAERLVHEHVGGLVTLRAVDFEQRVPWAVYATAGRMVTVHFFTAAFNAPQRVEIEEHHDRVRITIIERITGYEQSGEYRSATVELHAEVGDRRVIDGVTGECRSAWV